MEERLVKLNKGSYKRPSTLLRITVSIVVLALAYLFFIYQPRQRELEGLKRELRSLEERLRVGEITLKKALEDAQALERLEREYREIQEKIAYFEEKLPRAKQFPQVLRQLTTLPKELKVDFIAIRPQATERQERYTRTPIEINLRCRYQELGQYLERVENLPRLVNIEDLEIHSGEDIYPLLEVRLLAIIYTVS